MRWIRYFRRKGRDEELAREIEAYLAHEIDENMAAGSATSIRSLFWKRPGRTSAMARACCVSIQDSLTVVVLSLALGIGANTADTAAEIVAAKTCPAQPARIGGDEVPGPIMDSAKAADFMS